MMKPKNNHFTPLLILLLPLLFLEQVTPAKILIIHAFYSGSAVLSWRSMGQHLVENGHHVHYLRWKDGHYHPPLPHQNMTQTVLSVNNEDGRYPFLTKEREAAFDIPFDILLNGGLSYTQIYKAAVKAYPLFLRICDDLLSNKELLSFLKSQNFQVAVVDLVGNECSLALTHHLGIPTVGFWGMQFASGETMMTVAGPPPSHAPNIFSHLTERMTFFQRLQNTLVHVASKAALMGQCWVLKGIIEKRIPGTPNPCDLLKELNGMVIMSDYSVDYPQLLPPTFVRAFGMHVKPKERLNPLPGDLESWMSNSGDEGVVYFATGYTMNPNLFSKRFIKAFLSAARKLPQRFLMKLDKDMLRDEEIPENVRIMDWIPQQEVLAHNHTRLFVTHCGLHGVAESLFNAVPMIGMPIFLDQGDNLVKLEKQGVVIPLNREKASAPEIYRTLKTALTDPKYKRNAERLSRLMKDEPFPPQERVRHLLEYLVRHEGAPHLKVGSRHLNFFQYYSLDILAFIVICAAALSYVFRILGHFLWRGVLLANERTKKVRRKMKDVVQNGMRKATILIS